MLHIYTEVQISRILDLDAERCSRGERTVFANVLESRTKGASFRRTTFQLTLKQRNGNKLSCHLNKDGQLLFAEIYPGDKGAVCVSAMSIDRSTPHDLLETITPELDRLEDLLNT